MSRCIVLIGATGFFGQRLAHRLASIDDVSLVLTSRSEAKARALAQRLGGGEPIGALAFDRDDAASVVRLKKLSPWLVIDASGPFQGASFDLARTAIEAGAHWIDLADACDYLLRFGTALDSAARERGVVARTGASSTPALSMAVVEEITRDWRRVDTIEIAILPGGKGEVGKSVIRATLSYAGAQVATFSEGRSQKIVGWGSSRRRHVDGLGTRHVSPVETADATLMSERFAVTSRVTFGAALESRLEQFGLLVLAQLRRRGWLSDLKSLTPFLMRARALTRLFASDQGGMVVDCVGLNCDGRLTSARWKLHALPGQGPDVPVLPAVALVRALLRGDEKAGAAIASLPLAAIESEMVAPALTTSRSVAVPDVPSLIETACGAAYADLPSALRAFHDQDAPPVWEGKADIDASDSGLGGIVRRVFGFPPSGHAVDVTVSVDRTNDGEIWIRNFGGQRFFSRLKHEGGNVVSERFGAFSVLLGLKVGSDEIEMPVVGWRVGALRLPLFLAPKSETREFVGDDGRFHFDVAISVPFIGRLVHYRGWLRAKAAARDIAGVPPSSSETLGASLLRSHPLRSRTSAFL
jgi:Domain of unknown function (DUF4166)/Saccharopine dehydrogenase NADP binding domain